MSDTPRKGSLATVIAVAVVSAAAGAVVPWSYFRSGDVYVVNGLHGAVSVSVAGRSATVPPTGAPILFADVSAGPPVAVVRAADGRLIEVWPLLVRGGGRVQIYNVAGAAPVYSEEVVYTSRRSSADDARGLRSQLHCGDRLIVYPSVDYLFVKPPESLRMDSRQSEVSKLALGVASGGVMSCANWAFASGKEGLARSWAKLPGEGELVGLVVGDPRAMAHLIQRADGMDEVTRARRAQDVVREFGDVRALTAKYAAAAAAPNASDVDIYLHARLLDAPEDARVLEAGLARNPRSPWLRWAHSFVAALSGDYARALADLESIGPVPPAPLARAIVDAKARAHLHLGNPRAVLALVAGEREPLGLDLALSYFAALDVEKDAPLNIPEDVSRWAHLLRGDTPPPRVDDDPAFELTRATLTGQLSAAFDGVDAAAQATIRRVPDPVTALLVLEAWRIGRRETAAQLGLHAGHLDARALRTFVVTGTMTVLEQFDEDIRAVAWFMRGRYLEASGQDPSAAYGEARRLDIVRAGASRALFAWPRPARAEAHVWQLSPRDG